MEMTTLSALVSNRNRFFVKFFMLLLLFLGVSVSEGWGQHSITGVGSGNTYTQNFNTFAGTSATLPSNWTWSWTDYTPGAYYNRSAAYSNSNSTYGLRESASPGTDIAFGGKIDNSTYHLVFSATNNTGAAIGGFTITWNVEQYSASSNATPVNFSYRINGGTYGVSGVTGTTLTTASTLTTAANLASITTTSRTITISGINLAISGTIDFRFSIGNGTANNAHIGVDDFTVYASTASNTAPTVTTQAPTSILSTTVTGNGNITETGGASPTARGFCWDLAANADPDINDTKVEETGTFSTGAFTGSITGLTAGTQYKVRAYATNSVGTSYGAVQTFSTLSAEPSTHATSFSATANSQTQIDLAFSAASTITNAAGYVILQKSGAAPTGFPVDATTYTVGNSIGDGTVAAIITNTADVSKSITGLNAGTQYYFTLIPYNGSATTINYKTDGSVSVVNVTTVAPLDATSKVDDPTSQVLVGNISSLTTTSGAAIDVFKFKISDLATSDAVATKITQVKIKKSSGSADWTDHIAGAELWDGLSHITTGTVVITDADITFPITSGNLDIASGSNKEITLKIWLNSSNIVDNSTMVFAISKTTHGFVADAVASTFASDFGAAVTGNTMTVIVEATKLAFVQQPTNVGTSANITPAITVSANDVNNNRDLDYVTDVSISATGLSASPVLATPVSGLATFSTLSFAAAAAGVSLNATSSSLTAATSSLFDILLLPAAGEIVINQISPDYGGASDEYIELVNRSNKTFDLSHLKIEYQSSGGSSGSAGGNLTGSIGPYQYWLLSPNATITVGQTTSLSRDGSITAGFSSSAAQIALRLKNSPNTIIDGIAYGTVSPNNLGEGTTATAPPADGGLKRVSEGIDNNANSTDFTPVTQANIYLRNSSSVCIASNYTLPSASYSADVIVSGTSPEVTLSGNTTISGKLTIASGSLNVGASQALSVTGTLTNNGTLNLKSSASGTATLIHSTENVAATVEQNYMGAYRTWYMSSPVANAQPAGMNRIKYYDETNNTWPTLFDARTESAVPYNSNVFEKAKGYQVVPDNDDAEIEFAGQLNTGNISIALTRSGTNTVKPGFNLVGNPYPSYIEWTELYAANSSVLQSGTMWYRTKSGSYTFWTVNGAGVGTPAAASQYIPPMQAFWVRTITGGGNLNFTNDMRAHAPGSNHLFKAPSASKSDLQLLRLQLNNGTNTDEAVVYFSSNASNSIDALDAPKMSNDDASVAEIFTRAGNSPFAINAMNSIPLDSEIAMGFVQGNANAFSISVSELTNLPSGVKVIIKDKATQTETDLTEGDTYQFGASSYIGDRFSIIFHSGISTGLETANADKLAAYCNANKQIELYFESKNAGNAMIHVINLTGQTVVSQKVMVGTSTINATLEPGVYVVKVNNLSRKVVVE